jgi:hypothetical protein
MTIRPRIQQTSLAAAGLRRSSADRWPAALTGGRLAFGLDQARFQVVILAISACCSTSGCWATSLAERHGAGSVA